MKILTFIFSICSLSLFAQNSSTFQPHWEFGMQYNYEGNSAFKSNNNDPFTGRISEAATIHKMLAGYSFSVDGKFHISKHIAVLSYLGFASRNYASTTPLAITIFTGSGLGQPINLNSSQTTTYNAIEFAAGIAIKPKADSKLCLSTGLGLANTSNFEVVGDLTDSPTGSFFVNNNTLISGTPLFAFFTLNYTLKETDFARLFIEPHFKMDLVNRNNGSNSKQSYYTLGIGIGGSIKIFD